MALLTTAPRGTGDVLPADSKKWQYVERKLLEIAELYGFRESRVPVFEHTELFTRSVGDTTDVVQKEMYTFTDKGDRSITLRPEGTAGTVRSVLEHGLLNEALPVKVSYVLSCYRYEKPQAGRLREFHQFGVECFGAADPTADAEVISLADDVLQTLGVRNMHLEINSIGCPTCRAKYQQALRDYFAAHSQELCGTCVGRLERNPMRILDCKSPVCSKIAADAPKILDYLCEDCKQHFETLQALLTQMQINYVVNPTIVRGLDYYTRTVFEFVSDEIGSQGTVCGGGRYDGLVEQMGGNPTPALGFAMGLERLMMLMDKQCCPFPENDTPDLYLAPMGAAAQQKAAVLAADLRREGFSVLTDVMGRSLKAQMKYADKIHADFVCVLGDSELEQGTAVLKNMKTGESVEFAVENLTDALYDAQTKLALAELEESAAAL
ncbi:MAG: histidine--tRNA ligase [Clostridia bacterium]|nr:histidine--tRNA ligase [Clostridia bacterium]